MARQLSDLHRKNIVVYDCEIKKPVEQCAKRWKGYDEMGISVACAFDYRDMCYRVFMDDNMHELVERLNEPGTLVVAFNHIGFDNNLLKANCPGLRDDLKNYDMLVESRRGAGVDQFAKGFKLDDHLKANGLPVKTGDGAMAPIWWQEGKFGKVIDYCLNDVRVERMLFEFIWLKGELMSGLLPKPFAVALPEVC